MTNPTQFPIRGRRNLASSTAECWQPPAYSNSRSLLSRVVSRIRRFLDLQYASIWADLSSQLPPVRGAVLDAGCGAQPFRCLFQSGTRYTGIDTVHARANFGYEIPDTLYFDGNRWPIDDNSVDFLLCTETLEHVPETATFLSEAARCLVPGGRLLLTVPFAARWHYIPHDYWRFTPSSLKMLLSSAGFTGIEVYARGNEVTVACYKVMALILPLLMPQKRGLVQSGLLRIVGGALSPVLVLLAVVGNISLKGAGGDDCLGYTVIATAGDVERANIPTTFEMSAYPESPVLSAMR